ncbi:unnamed protein product [Pedinophyceae sp. YPF-701]|nr:unnamed protein product [Pedinophyceae sp. YPF-701]
MEQQAPSQEPDEAMQAPSPQTQLREWFRGIPLCTKSLLVVNVSIFVVAAILGWDNYRAVCMAPYALVSSFQIYRVVTSMFVHLGLLHIAFNMLAFVPIGSVLERSLGTLRLAHTILALAIVSAVLHVATAAALLPFTPTDDQFYACSVGFSGIIFGLIVVETAVSGAERRSLFGFFTVPAKVYPYALVAFLQLIMPSVSLLGHLSGALAGQAYAAALAYNSGAVTQAHLLARVEAAPAFGRVVALPSYIHGRQDGLPVAHAPAGHRLGGSERSGGGGLMASLTEAVRGAIGRAWGPRDADGGGDGDGRAVGPATVRGGYAYDAVSITDTAPARPPPSQGGAPGSEARPARPQSDADRRRQLAMAAAARRAAGGGGNAADGGGAGAELTAGQQEVLAGMIEMGYGRDRARRALEASGWDVGQAVDALSSGNIH